MATTSTIHTLHLSDGTPYTVKLTVDLDALARDLGRKALRNHSKRAALHGRDVVVTTVDTADADTALAESLAVHREWIARLDQATTAALIEGGCESNDASVFADLGERVAYRQQRNAIKSKVEADYRAVNPWPTPVTA